MIHYEYKNLFNKSSDVSDMRIGQITMNEKWNWISMVDRLSDGDITKHEEVYKINYIYCLNILSYWYERDEYNKQIERAQNKRY